MKYHDGDGNPISLEKLCRTEPVWAVSIIRKLKKGLRGMRSMRQEVECPDCDGVGCQQPSSAPDDCEIECGTCGGQGHFVPYRRIKELLKQRAHLFAMRRALMAGREPLHEIIVGRYTISTDTTNIRICKDDGEGGNFSPEALEKHLDAFFDKEF